MSIDLILPNNDNLRPREEITIEDLTASFLPDGRRVRVEIAVTPFREQPNLEIALLDAAGRRVASASAVAIMTFRVAFVLHLRGTDQPAGDLTARVLLYYDDPGAAQSTRSAAVHPPPAGDRPPAALT